MPNNRRNKHKTIENENSNTQMMPQITNHSHHRSSSSSSHRFAARADNAVSSGENASADCKQQSPQQQPRRRHRRRAQANSINKSVSPILISSKIPRSPPPPPLPPPPPPPPPPPLASPSQSSSSSSSALSIFPNQFSADSIKIMLERSTCVFAPIDHRVIGAISCALHDRLTALIHRSVHSMRHSFRTKLTPRDVSQAMRDLDCDLIFGHHNLSPNLAAFAYDYVPEAKVYVHRDSAIDLRRDSAQIVTKRLVDGDDYYRFAKTIYEVDWLQSKYFACDDDYDDDNGTGGSLKRYVTKICDAVQNIHSSSSRFARAERESVLRVIFRDIATNRNIRGALNRLIRFALNALSALRRIANLRKPQKSLQFAECSLQSVMVYVRMLYACTRNKHFPFWSLRIDAIDTLAEIVLSICFDPRLLPFDEIDDHHNHHDQPELLRLFQLSIEIRTWLARIFAQISFRCCLPFTDQQHRLIRLMRAKIDSQRMIEADLAARMTMDGAIISVHRHLGFDLCLRNLPALLAHIRSYSFDSSIGSNLQRFASSFLYGELCQLAELIMKKLAHITVDTAVAYDSKRINDIFRLFSHRFGDVLASRLPTATDIVLNRQQQRRRRRGGGGGGGVEEGEEGLSSDDYLFGCDNDDDDQIEEEDDEDEGNNDDDENESTKIPVTTDLIIAAANRVARLRLSLRASTNHRPDLFDRKILKTESQLRSNSPKIFLYAQDLPNYNSAENFRLTNPNACDFVIIFDGERCSAKTGDTEGSEINFRLPVSYEPSAWHREMMKATGRSYYPRTAYLPGSKQNAVKREQLDSVIGLKRESADDVRLARHRTFHHHRLRQHRRTNYSLYTQL